MGGRWALQTSIDVVSRRHQQQWGWWALQTLVLFRQRVRATEAGRWKVLSDKHMDSTAVAMLVATLRKGKQNQKLPALRQNIITERLESWCQTHGSGNVHLERGAKATQKNKKEGPPKRARSTKQPARRKKGTRRKLGGSKSILRKRSCNGLVHKNLPHLCNPLGRVRVGAPSAAAGGGTPSVGRVQLPRRSHRRGSSRVADGVGIKHQRSWGVDHLRKRNRRRSAGKRYRPCSWHDLRPRTMVNAVKQLYVLVRASFRLLAYLRGTHLARAS